MVFLVLGRKGWRRCLAGAFCGMLLLLGAVTLWGQRVEETSLPLMDGERKIPIYSVQREEKYIALGLNCAWGDEDVDKILAILAKEEVPATFFVVGDWAEKYPIATRKLFEAGHEVQSHSNKHKDMTTLGKEEIVADIRAAESRISQITGVRPTLFRAPSGAYDDLLVETVEELGYRCVQWDVDSIDWKNPSPDEMCNRVIRKVQPGSITLFHVGAKNTPEALPLIIKELKLQGYSFRSVSDLLLKGEWQVDFQGRQVPKAAPK